MFEHSLPTHPWFALTFAAAAAVSLAGCELRTSAADASSQAALQSGLADDDQDWGESIPSAGPRMPKAPKLSARSADAVAVVAKPKLACGKASLPFENQCEASQLAGHREQKSPSRDEPTFSSVPSPETSSLASPLMGGANDKDRSSSEGFKAQYWIETQP